MPDVNLAFGAWVDRLMTARNLSGYQVSEAAGKKGFDISHFTVDRARRGVVPGRVKLRALAVGLGVTEQEIEQRASRASAPARHPALDVWEAMTPDQRQQWLGIGDLLLGRPAR